MCSLQHAFGNSYPSTIPTIVPGLKGTNVELGLMDVPRHLGYSLAHYSVGDRQDLGIHGLDNNALNNCSCSELKRFLESPIAPFLTKANESPLSNHWTLFGWNLSKWVFIYSKLSRGRIAPTWSTVRVTLKWEATLLTTARISLFISSNDTISTRESKQASANVSLSGCTQDFRWSTQEPKQIRPSTQSCTNSSTLPGYPPSSTLWCDWRSRYFQHSPSNVFLDKRVSYKNW